MPGGTQGICILIRTPGDYGLLFSRLVQKYQFFGVHSFFMVQFSHPYMTTGFLDSLVGKESAMHETPVQFLGWEDPLKKG